ncbi:hypothetical protein ACOMHN_030925 [Nucella lapillus]
MSPLLVTTVAVATICLSAMGVCIFTLNLARNAPSTSPTTETHLQHNPHPSASTTLKPSSRSSSSTKTVDKNQICGYLPHGPRRRKPTQSRSDVISRHDRRRKRIKSGSDITSKRGRRRNMRTENGTDVTGSRRKRIGRGSDVSRGRSRRRQKRIVQGDEVVRGQFPWMVMVLVRGGFVCGGTIIHSRYVLTAAHCLRPTYQPYSRKEGFASFYNASDVEVIAGKHSYVINSGLHDVMSEQRVSVHDIIQHEKYDDSKRVAKHYDLAILELQEALTWTDWVSPICLPEPRKKPSIPKHATVLGWGGIEPRYRLNWIPKAPKALKQLKVKLWTKRKCVRHVHLDYVKYMTSRQICAVSVKPGVSSTCNGDSGGPLFIEDTHGSHVQLGVLSWGYCHNTTGVPSFFTYLPRFVPWIRTVTGRNRRRSQRVDMEKSLH